MNFVKKRQDVMILILVALLLFMGIVMVYSSSAFFALDKYRSTYYFLKKQLFWILVGSLMLILFRNIKYEVLQKYSKFLFAAAIVLMFFVFIPHIGKASSGAKRWIYLFGFSFEPSELLKLAFIIYMADAISRKQEQMKSFAKGLLPFLIIIGVVSVILYLQPDLGAILLMFSLGMIMLFVGGVRLRHVLMSILISSPLIYVAIIKASYRAKRILAFLDPWKDPQGVSFQIVQSFIAFGSGGLFGKGLGKSTQKLFYLPEAHTDFIFAIVGEELGLIGASVILALFAFLIWKGIGLSLEIEDNFGKLLVVGVISYIGLQAFINMSVVTGLLPTKGMTLPFISYGGSSLVINMIAIGILLNCSSRINNEKGNY